MDAHDLLATGPIAAWVLILGLFFPRLALFLAWLGTGSYPPNPLPDLVNLVFWLFLPRWLIAFYIYADMGPDNLWFWAYVIIGIAGFFGESGYVRHRIVRRRTTVSQDGRTTTTVEEEEV